MKISIGTNIKEGPWGGGNLFAKNLKNYLENSGHTVIDNLNDNDIDLILITEPRKTSESSAFTNYDVEKYLKYVKNDTIVVHRINECDERKNTNFVNKFIIKANEIADFTIFVSSWLQNLYKDQGLNTENSIVIKAGANESVFNSLNKKTWTEGNKLKIVTHHWGANWNKGFHIYEFLDHLLENEEWRDKVEFTYIGNLPKKFSFKNTTHLQPTQGDDLAEKLKNNHIYLTASINEPSGNHHIEGAQCGLPLLYLDSGGIPEYCDGYGVKFTHENFEIKLKEMIDQFPKYLDSVKNYPNNASIMSKEYEKLFMYLYKNKTNVTVVRKKYRFNFLDRFFYQAVRNYKIRLR